MAGAPADTDTNTDTDTCWDTQIHTGQRCACVRQRWLVGMRTGASEMTERGGEGGLEVQRKTHFPASSTFYIAFYGIWS